MVLDGIALGLYCFFVFFGFLLGLAALITALWAVGKLCGIAITFVDDDDDDDDGCAT